MSERNADPFSIKEHDESCAWAYGNMTYGCYCPATPPASEHDDEYIALARQMHESIAEGQTVEETAVALRILGTSDRLALFEAGRATGTVEGWADYTATPPASETVEGPQDEIERFARAMHLARLAPDREEPYCDNPLTDSDLAAHMRWAEAILWAARMLPPYERRATPPASGDVEAARVAQWFHEAYERLAPSFGYETREASAVPWADVPEPNRSLMVAVAGEVLSKEAAIRAESDGLDSERLGVFWQEPVSGDVEAESGGLDVERLAAVFHERYMDDGGCYHGPLNSNGDCRDHADEIAAEYFRLAEDADNPRDAS